MNIAFAGTPHFAAEHLRALMQAGMKPSLVITRPDKPGKRGKQPLPSPVKQLAESASLPIIQPASLTPESLNGHQLDIMVVVAFGEILKQSVLDIPRLGCINVHASLLPAWRGAAPIQRALLAGDTQTGITIMQMDAGMDTGDILATSQLDIAADDTSASLEAKLISLGCPLLLSTLKAYATGQCQARPQVPGRDLRSGSDASQAPGITGNATHSISIARKITKQEAAINWHQDANQVARHIRSFNPDPVAFSCLDNLNIKFWQATPIDSSHIYKADIAGQPGEILQVTKQGAVIACGTGALLVTALQVPLGKGSVLTGHEIRNARGNVICPGARFSPVVS